MPNSDNAKNFQFGELQKVALKKIFAICKILNISQILQYQKPKLFNFEK